MSVLYENIVKLCELKGVSGYQMCKDIGMQPSILTDLKMGRQKGLSAKSADKVASYFGVTVGYLLGKEKQKEKPTLEQGERDVFDDELVKAFRHADAAKQAAIRLLLGI